MTERKHTAITFLNIGRDVGDAKDRVVKSWVDLAIKRAIPDAVVIAVNEHEFLNENTFVVQLMGVVRDDEIAKLAEILLQDAIASWEPTFELGLLHGPKAAKWGKFDPNMFVMPDGTTLGTMLEALPPLGGLDEDD